MISPESGATVEIKLGDEGIVVIASTWQTYDELSIEVKEIEDETN
jgi:hypothetical protein